MEEDFIYVELFEIYKDLLTEHQREMFSSHYFLDLSLSEIAEPEGVSRQNVYSALKKVKEKLLEYENKLKIKEKNEKLDKILNEIKDEKIKEKIIEIIKS